MQLAQLKEEILNNTLSDQFMIFTYITDSFLPNTYIDEICKLKGFDKNIIDSLSELNSTSLSLVIDFNNDLNILICDEFNEDLPDYNKCTNTIVLCKKIDKKIADKVESYVVAFPNVEDWQIKAYIAAKVPEIRSNDIYEGLLNSYKVTDSTKKPNWDMYKVDNEIDKILLFDPKDRESILDAYMTDQNNDLLIYTVFNLIDAIMHKNIEGIAYLLKYRFNCDFEPVVIVNLLLRNFRTILTYNGFYCGKAYNKAEINYYQYKDATAICAYSVEEIIKNINFLSEINQNLKLGKLDLERDQFLSYIITNVVAY